MSTTNDTLEVKKRASSGTTSSNAIRREGGIPAVLYGHGEPMSIAIDRKAFDELLHAGGKNHLLNVAIDGARPLTAIVRDVQRDPISRRVIAADLQRVSATEEISASVPLVTVGVAEGVKTDGGVMDVVVHTLDVSGPANAVPEQLEIDVSALKIHDHVTAGDVKLPAKFKLGVDPATVLVTIEPSRTEQAVAEADEAAAEAAAEAAPEPEAQSEAEAKGEASAESE